MRYNQGHRHLKQNICQYKACVHNSNFMLSCHFTFRIVKFIWSRKSTLKFLYRNLAYFAVKILNFRVSERELRNNGLYLRMKALEWDTGVLLLNQCFMESTRYPLVIGKKMKSHWKPINLRKYGLIYFLLFQQSDVDKVFLAVASELWIPSWWILWLPTTQGHAIEKKEC